MFYEKQRQKIFSKKYFFKTKIKKSKKYFLIKYFMQNNNSN